MIVKRAVIKWRDRRTPLSLDLVRIERTVYRWFKVQDQQSFEHTADCLDERMAMKALRVAVETGPDYVGADLTILDVAPPPELRAAERICQGLLPNMLEDKVDLAYQMSQITARETAINSLTPAISELVSYVFTRRSPFARALFPVTPQGEPRDMVLDGLLLNAIEAMEKSTGLSHENLTKMLKQPVSTISIAQGMPGKGRSN